MIKLSVVPTIFILVLFSICAHGVQSEGGMNTEIRYLYVQPGQTLHNIVKRLYPEREAQWDKLRQQIVRENPHGFINGDETRMKAGVRLELPRRYVTKPMPVQMIPQERKAVGKVIVAEGQTIAVGRDNITRMLVAGDSVFLGDKLITGSEGFLRLKMVDLAQLDLRCYSIMVIEEYDLHSPTRTSVLNLLQGSLRKVTGEIGKWKEDVYELRTPVASVGVRGTEYALRVFQSQGCRGSIDTGDDGLYLRVIEGLVDVYNKAGKTEVAKGDTLYIALPDKAPQQKTIKPGVLEPVAKAPVEASNSVWWWAALGVVLIAIAL
jgi:hypothetical protein